MSELIERLTNATEGSRELDAEINLAVFSQLTFPEPPHYTTSIDAALTLVPEGCWWTLNASGYVNIWKPGGNLLDDEPISTTWPADQDEAERKMSPAIGICIAALEARAIKSQERTE
jgi:hypothetical protein